MKLIRVLGCCLAFAALLAQGEEATVEIRVDPDTTVARISDDFIGFGYETSAVAQSNYFNGANTTLIHLYDNLTPHGLIRIGGNVSDHTRFDPTGTAVPKTEREVTIINDASLLNLRDFARATGWKVMWGLNLGTGSKDQAVREAVAVDKALGPNLHSFEIGNEVDALRRFEHHYDEYYPVFKNYKAAIRAALPNAKFSGPDVIGNWGWITNFAANEGGDMQLLTQHYYRGDAKNPKSTLALLLAPDTHMTKRLDDLRKVCQDDHLSFRINEVNSFSSGGKQGVSDCFGSALWCLDYLFKLASHGCEGVNLETDVNQLGFISHYSPIVHDASGRCVARPEYYAMLAFAQSGKGDVVQLTAEGADSRFSAYATKASEDVIWMTAINRSFSANQNLRIRAPIGMSQAALWRLTAPSVASNGHVSLAGAEVGADGTWKPKPPEARSISDGIVQWTLPPANAVLIKFSRN